MQETMELGPVGVPCWDLTGQGLYALLSLVGARRMDVQVLRERTKLTPPAFMALMERLQRECLVDLVSALDGNEIREKVELTEEGESLLLSLLERTCELPELR